jgi:hypothetical protein
LQEKKKKKKWSCMVHDPWLYRTGDGANVLIMNIEYVHCTQRYFYHILVRNLSKKNHISP